MSLKVISLLFALGGLFAAVDVDELRLEEARREPTLSIIAEAARAISISVLPAALNTLNLGDATQIIVSSGYLQSLYSRLMPLADRLITEAALPAFLSAAGFSEAFIHGVLPDLRCALTAKDELNSNVCTQALKKTFGNNSFLELSHQNARKITEYLQRVNEGNKILGNSYWRVQYAGTIGGVHLEVGTRIADWQIHRLADEGAVREDLRALEQRLRSSTLIAPDSPCYFIASEDGLFADTGSALLQLTTHPLVIGTRLETTWRLAIGSTLIDDLAGIEECRDVVGIMDSRLNLEDDPDHSKFCTAIEYLVIRRTIPMDLKLSLYLLHNCYFPRE